MRIHRTLALLLAAGLSGCRDPRAEANVAQAMTEVGTTLTLPVGVMEMVGSIAATPTEQPTILHRRLRRRSFNPRPPF